MMRQDERSLTSVTGYADLAREKTPARLLVDRAGGSYLTATHLQLRADHAAARDAVHEELALADFGEDIVSRYGLFLVQTEATSKAEYLLRPDLGRRLSATARKQIRERTETMQHPVSPEPEGKGPLSRPLQIVIGDGLSARAVKTQVPGLLPLLIDSAHRQGWIVAQPFVIRYCRVGVMNDIGELLTPDVVVLLIGERPGLATAESLSAYMAFRPKSGDTDERRNLISNIHARGVRHEAAVARILDLAAQMCERQTSGVEIKERVPGSGIEAASGDAPSRVAANRL
jgi:ethanolamine ammonia-lyase small subunit